MEPDQAPSAAKVLGDTCRELRGSHRTEDLARAVTAAGLPWTTARVAHLESGKVSPTVTTLFALARGFSDLLDRPVTLADLMVGDRVLLGNKEIDLSVIRDALNGQPVQPPSGADAIAATMKDFASEMSTWPQRLRDLPFGRHRRTVETWRETDQRMVPTLGLSRSRVLAEMALLWGQSLTAQRDEIAGADANQQRRGRISRDLVQQLKESIGDGNDS